jgi:regulatory protein
VRRPSGKKALDPEKASDSKSAHAFAIAYLARRDFSVSDLRRKLKDRGFAESAIEPVIAELESSNVINDGRYGDNVVAHRARRGQGPARIARSSSDRAWDPKRSRPRWTRQKRTAGLREPGAGGPRPKFGPELPKDWKERSRQARFLQYRGFSTDHIRAVLEGVPDDESGADPDGEPDPN